MIKVDNAHLLDVAHGAIQERLDYELSKVIDNIDDLNTKADACTNEQHRKFTVFNRIRRGQSISRNVAASAGANVDGRLGAR